MKNTLPGFTTQELSEISKLNDSENVWNGWAQLQIFSAYVMVGVLPQNLPVRLSHTLLITLSCLVTTCYSQVTRLKKQSMIFQWSALKNCLLVIFND